MKNAIGMFNGKVFGIEVSDYGKENGYLDYQTLAEMLGDCILNNNILSENLEEWEIVNGEFDYEREIYQFYIITDYGFDILQDYTDEIVFYNERLDMYVWGVTHFGTSWDYVLTDVELEEH